MASALRAAHAASGALLKGRSAVVSGGTSGIGEGLALRLASLGASVHILGRSAERGAEVLAQLRALNPEGSHGLMCSMLNSSAVLIVSLQRTQTFSFNFFNK